MLAGECYKKVLASPSISLNHFLSLSEFKFLPNITYVFATKGLFSLNVWLFLSLHNIFICLKMIITRLEYELSERMTECSDLNLLCEWRGEFLLPGFYSEAIIVAQLRLIRPIKSCHSHELA